MTSISNIREIFFVFLRLGLISFGGPIAHLGFFHAEFVIRRRWLQEAAYADMVALCQFLPGPASSQVGFLLGLIRGGLPGALAAWLGFTLPSALLMIGFAYGISALALRGLDHAGWLHGLKVAAVAVVAQAVWSMSQKLCPDGKRMVIALLSAVAVLAWPLAAAQIAVITCGAILGWLLFRKKIMVGPKESLPVACSRSVAIACLAAFLCIAVLPLLHPPFGDGALKRFESFYQVGALVFGGGHVMLPLLQARVVATGWVSGNDFLAGYGAAQALPGPLATFAAYLGTLMQTGSFRWLGGLWCLVAIYLPSALLLLGVLPFWESLRQKPWAQAALNGTNAAVVGLLLAALYNPVWTAGIYSFRELALALIGFGLLVFLKCPPWLVVGFSAIAGFFLLG